MRLRRILLIGINIVLVATFGPFIGELLSTDLSAGSTFKVSSVSLPPPVQKPEHPELARTLFHARPLPVDSESLSPEKGSTSNVRLLGVILTEEQRIAVVERAGVALRVEEGDMLDGWQVTMIAARKIRLQSEEQNIDVLLDPPVDQR
ncbi:hypothetical protein [Microvirga flavescens]|uniref:hypothetical protein n=1 Tax=Microvirga flavescens TaxID=2249811 RepID=UPI000DD9E3CC|nr:hypothetical protein [Microvirga flavescens]